jgi:hypothetical protein
MRYVGPVGARRVGARALVSLCVSCVFSCRPPAEERVTCDDLLPPEQATFAALVELVTQETPDKGCSVAKCHGSEEAEFGYRFDERAAIFDALTTQIDVVYAQVASGEMPPEGRERWDENDLRLLRTWYCNGAFSQ